MLDRVYPTSLDIFSPSFIAQFEGFNDALWEALSEICSKFSYEMIFCGGKLLVEKKDIEYFPIQYLDWCPRPF